MPPHTQSAPRPGQVLTTARYVPITAGMPVIVLLSIVATVLIGFLLRSVATEDLTLANVAALLGGAGLIAFSYRLTFDLLSPPVLLTGTWALTLFLATFDIQFQGRYSVFNGPVFPMTWVILVGSILAFVFGTVLGTIFSCVRHQSRQVYYDPKRIRIVIYLSFGLGVLGYAICYFTAGTAPILVDHLNDIRTDFRLSKYGLLMAFFMVTTALTAYTCGSFGVFSNWKLILLALLSYACMLSTTERADSFQSSVVAAMTYLLARRDAVRNGTIRASVMSSVAPLGIASVVLIAAFLYIGSARSASDRGVAANKVVDLESDLVAQLYIYSYVPSIKNLQWGMEQPITHSYGMLTARPLIWILGRLSWIPEDVDFGGVNTVTWLWYYYRDFGYLGTIGIPLVLGFISSVVYLLTLRNPTIRTITLYGLIASCIIWTGGTERFCETLTIIYAALLVTADIFCRRPATAPR